MTPTNLAPCTLLDLISSAPDSKVALIAPEQNIQLTYGRLREQVKNVAEAFFAAAVALRHNGATEADLLAYCKEHLADFKRPKKIYIARTIPRTATGKIQRRNVASAYAEKA